MLRTEQQEEGVALKTQGVKNLVEEVISTLAASERGEHVIRNVFVAIEGCPTWRARYDLECRGLGEPWIVNNWIGKWTRECVGHQGVKKQVAMAGCSLAGSYSVLG